MVNTLIPYFGIAALMLAFVAYDRWRRRNQFSEAPRDYQANNNGSDWTPSTGFWSGDSSPSWSSSGGDSSCSVSGGDSGGSCGDGGGGGGGGD